MSSERRKEAKNLRFTDVADYRSLTQQLPTADATLAAISPELYEAILASPNHFLFNRSLHRDDHLGEIARILER